MKYFLSKLIFIFSLFFSSAYANESAWSLLEEGGKIVFIRHAYAPGGGDPDNFVIEDCSTQRNLNQQGIDQSISCLLYTSPSPRDKRQSRMPSSA